MILLQFQFSRLLGFVLLFVSTTDPLNRNNAHNADITATSALPKANFTWQIPERYEASWRAWSANSNTYEKDFLNPDRGQITLDASGSTGGGENIINYDWQLKGIDNPSYYYRRNYGTIKKLTVRDPDLKPGRYNAILKIETRSGKKDSTKQTINIKDWLIVSIGDSFSSGEGNPDKDGEYGNGGSTNLAACQGEVGHVTKRAVWQDVGCHRSKWSAPALMAENIEKKDDHSSVTFLSFACSGAETKHLVNERYEGPDPQHEADKNLLPQIVAVKNAIGSRSIDALIISVGINDLYFSTVLKECGNPANVFNGDDPCMSNKIFKNLKALEAKYDKIANAIESSLKVKAIYIIEYPTNVLVNAQEEPKVCECLELGPNWARTGVSPKEVDWLSFAGRNLNTTVAKAARRHNWNYVYGVYDRFSGRGYCEELSKRYFRRVKESVRLQGHKHGGMHPNRRGHEVVSDLLLQAIELGAKTKPQRKITVTFDKVMSNNPLNQLHFAITIRQRVKEPFRSFWGNGFNDFYTEFINMNNERDKWTDLPKGKYQFTFNVYEPPQPIGRITDFDIWVVADGVNLQKLSFANLPNFGNGEHTLLTPSNISKRAGIKFKVNVVALAQGEANTDTNPPIGN